MSELNRDSPRDKFTGVLKFRKTKKTRKPNGDNQESTTLLEIGIYAAGVLVVVLGFIAWLNHR